MQNILQQKGTMVNLFLFRKCYFFNHLLKFAPMGMNPKTLQIILGHSAVHITMNLYCHVTEDMLVSEMSKFENGASGQGVNHQNGVKVV